MLADGYGNVVHLGERECSLQRRHQKVIEEAPSPLLDAATRARIGAAACDTARSVDYTGAGTVEFIVSADRPDEFFFMEMNTRLQVEHPVTEMVTGIDLVEQQVRIAAGEKLPVAQDDITMTGHAIEARVYAEDPGARLPADRRARCSASPSRPARASASTPAWRDGTVVGSDYDPMLAKVIAHAADRRRGAARARPRAGRHRRARRDDQRRVPALPAGRPRRRRGSARHRAVRPPDNGLRGCPAGRRRADRRGGIQVAAQLAGARRRPVGGAVGLADRAARADDHPAARGRAHRPRVPDRHTAGGDGRGRGRRTALADSRVSTATGSR